MRTFSLPWSRGIAASRGRCSRAAWRGAPPRRLLSISPWLSAVSCSTIHRSCSGRSPSALFMALTYFVQACKDTIRGLERTDIPAYIHVGQQLLALIIVFVVMVLGGGLRAALLAQCATTAIVLLATLPFLRSFGVGNLSIRWDTIKSLFSDGTPFVVFGLAMALQPNIDALFLSKFAPVEVMGGTAFHVVWLGTLLLPATTLIGALYPTLCRLYTTDRESFARTANGALRSVALLAVPVALCCGLYPEIGRCDVRPRLVSAGRGQSPHHVRICGSRVASACRWARRFSLRAGNERGVWCSASAWLPAWCWILSWCRSFSDSSGMAASDSASPPSSARPR